MSVDRSMAAEVHIYQIIMIWRRILSPALFSPFPGFSERDMMDSLSDRLGWELVIATPTPYVIKSNHFLLLISALGLRLQVTGTLRKYRARWTCGRDIP